MHNFLPNVKHLSPWILSTRKPEVSVQLFGFKDFPDDLDGTYGQQDTRIDNTWHWQHISSLLIGHDLIIDNLSSRCYPHVFCRIPCFVVFFKIFGGHKSFLWGHWYHCLRLLVTSPLGFKARVAASFLAWQRHTGYMFLETYGLHVPWDIRVTCSLRFTWEYHVQPNPDKEGVILSSTRVKSWKSHH